MNTVESEASLWKRLVSWRAVMVLLLHFSYLIFNIPVITTSMALVCMCGPLQPPGNLTQGGGGNESGEQGLEYFVVGNETRIQESYEFDWDADTRGLLITSFSFGLYLVPHMSNIGRGYLGNKMTLTAYAVVLALSNLLSPVAARVNVYYFLALRILSGLTADCQIPVSGDTLAWWIPSSEKLTAATAVIMGWTVSGMLLPLFAGYACLIPIDNGWPFIFYLNGALSLLWAVIWYSLSSRKPEDHPFISEAEKTYILSRRLGMGAANTKVKTPYKKILTSRPVWAFVVTSCCNVWSMIVIATCLPLYLTSVLQFSLQETGVVMLVNALLRTSATFFWTALGNWLKEKRSLSTSVVRKICVCVGQALAGLCYFGSSFFDHQNRWLAVSLVIAAVWVSTFALAMPSVIPLDMAPRHAGFLSALAASAANLVSISSPIFVTAIAANGLFEEWRLIWLTMTAVHLFAAGVFVFFGDASLQPWAETGTSGVEFIVSPTPKGSKQEEKLTLFSRRHTAPIIMSRKINNK